MISLIRKTLLRKLNFTLNIKATETCYLMKKSKQKNFTKIFENLKNVKNTWQGIKSIISIKSSFSNSPTFLTFQNENIDPEIIANVFNNYCSTIGEKTQAKIKHSDKKITSLMKILTRFSFHQLTKTKSNFFSSL